MKAQDFWNINNVISFRGFMLVCGEVSISDSEYVEHLNECYGTVSVCGNEYGQGDLFIDADPIAFRCGKSDYESSIQSELEDQLESEDDSDIVFHEELDEDEEE